METSREQLFGGGVQAPESEVAALKDYASAVRNLDFDRANEIAEGSGLSENEVAAAKRAALVERAYEGWLQDDPEDRTAALGLSDEIAESAEFQDALKRGLIINLAAGHEDSALRLMRRFNLPEETTALPEVLDGAKRGLRELLLQGSQRAAAKLVEDFKIPVEIISSLEVQDAAKKCMLKMLEVNHDVEEAREVAERFALRENVLSSVDVLNAVERCLGRKPFGKWWENK